MKEDAYKILKTAVEEHREQLLGSRQTCLGILRDFGGREHPEVNLLADAVEENIPDRLLRSQPITQDIIDGLAENFAATKFLNSNASKFAVSSWADALGLYRFDRSILSNSKPESNPLPMREDTLRNPESSWFYIDEQNSVGPELESSILLLARSSKISAETMLWSDGMKDWRPAIEVFPSMLFGANKISSQVKNDDILSLQPIKIKVAQEGNQIRPWIRLFARTIDMIAFGIGSGFIFAIVAPALLSIGDVFLGILIALLFVFVEPLMLSNWGTTLGKYLLNIKISKIDGTPMTYENGLGRSLNVWLKGIGLAIPLVGLFTQLASYNKLKKSGTTSWDEGKFLVIHRKIDPWKIVVSVIIGILFVILVGASE